MTSLPDTITRTYRAAIRIGEDFITLEETVCLQSDATDEQIAQAVDLGWRIYRAQREAAEQQIADVRTSRRVDALVSNYSGNGGASYAEAPASDKQRSFIARLQDKLEWTSEQLAVYASEQGVDLAALTKNQASSFIDGLKTLADRAGVENGILKWSERVVGKPTNGKARQPLAAGEELFPAQEPGEDLPF